MELFAALDTVLLSRLQFALTIMFHYLFPPLTIGLGLVLVYLGLRYVMTGDRLFRDAQKFWTKIYALNFAMGVSTGIVMEFEFGTNWSVYSEFVGDVFGSALAAEGIFAFFLESGFLAVLVFGWDRVGPKMHLFSTMMVSLGSIFSAVWIVAANSWQQTPAGHHIVPVYRRGEPWVVDGELMMRAEITDFWAMVFNPTTVIRLTHTLTGAFIVGGSLVASVGAWYLLKNRHIEFARRSLNGGLIVMTIGAFTAAATGHLQAKITYAYQPAKMAAYEGHFETGPGHLTVFGIPDVKNETVRYDLSIPRAYSFLLKEDLNAEIVGLDRFAPEDRPPIWIPFVTYRVMVGIGTYLIVLSIVAVVFRLRNKLYTHRPLLFLFVITVFLSLIANHGGWVACEVGRQPWIVHPPLEWTGGEPGVGDVVVDETGVVQYDETQGLRTTDAVSKAISGEQVLGSLIGFGLIYGLLFIVWITVLHQKIQKGPDISEDADTSSASVEDLLNISSSRVSHSKHMIEPNGGSGA
ncbi:cytochrome ubiquinol oxidase subunit I [Crateriforma conspicua]|uniref:Cytochrome bd-I ubiquinol oxidase subunit 1 n=1 Tax=Crateriforma conspicua TaxID=2527996 RepID=A0A5C5XY06_9PLAN|nr:cytochrome ubiquinol oxidase subunit I [Crateriforma conspicua]TWT68237.1 Cytochrome bd-I ubiquinol oxidase subunit 1 [Crateriforma conspicua]